jgi:hypothetical protein
MGGRELSEERQSAQLGHLRVAELGLLMIILRAL